MFSSDALHSILNETRFEDSAHTDTYRQLIHITHLDENYIRVLTKTAWFHQAEALRDAIYKHVDRKASLRVYIPGTTKVRNAWSDLSFLGLDSNDSDGGGEYFVSELHSSFIICGWDESKWAAYGFTNSDFDDDDEGEEEEEEEEEDQDGEKASSKTFDEDYHTLDDADDNYDLYTTESALEDHLAFDGKYRRITPQERSVWDPRLYFLEATDNRVRMVREEWAYLVNKIAAIVKIQNDSLTCVLPKARFSSDPSLAPNSLAWLMKTMKFLKELRQDFLITIETCQKFLAPDGDHNYFFNEDDQALGISLRNIAFSIRYSMEGLIELEKRLAFLEESCDSSKEMVALCMSQESVHLGHISIQHNKESAELSSIGNMLSREANMLNREANVLNKNNNHLAVYNKRVAAANNFNAALMLSMNQIMTPVVVVAGYFSIQEEIFGFPKTAKSFLISVAIVFVVLQLVNVGTFLLRHRFKTKWALAWILTGQLDQLLLDRKEIGQERDAVV
ncbi:hypothetical protein N0V90_003114 [Kalmusia sp. IMI 367209]|nr:hypothetical protein N0V90_003114 [Kalmusia sp. IMI 367209]